MSFEETQAKKLPPFGIKDLYGPSNPAGILHISAPQYDSTIRSYPDATLTYLDDDDGETILVGSGLELRQRLEEPVKLERPSRGSSSSPSRRTSFDDRLIHLFDIQHTANSHVVWREHEAYSSKTLRDRSEFSSIHGNGDTTPKSSERIAQAADIVTYPVLPVHQAEPIHLSQKEDDTVFESLKEPLAQDGSDHIQRHSSTSNDPLRDFMEKNIGTFADFLDTAAEVLRNVAKKTREADASPVESMLNGMKDVLAEVGQLGMEVLNGLDYEQLPIARKEAPTSPTEEASITTEVKQAAPELAAKPAPNLAKRVSFADMKFEAGEISTESPKIGHSESRDDPPSILPRPGPALDFFQHMSSTLDKTTAQIPPLPQIQTSEKAVPDPPVVIPEAVPSKNTAATAAAARYLAYRKFPNRPGPVDMGFPARSGSSTSIMDLETSNPDFAARYPPLMSLRRAKTVSDLQKKEDKAQEPMTTEAFLNRFGKNHSDLEKRMDEVQGQMTTKAALNRYPSIGQLWDVHGRPEYPYRKSRGRRGHPRAREASDAHVRHSLTSPVSPIVDTVHVVSQDFRRRYQNPTVEDESIETKEETPFQNSHNVTAYERVSKPLPGSWPEPKAEDTSALPVANESSGAFFNRMTGIKEPKHIPARPVSPALSCRNTGPPEDPFWPASNLRRANTITASNPAARLTKPFDPLIGTSKPIFPRGEETAPNKNGAASSLPKRSLTQREPPRTQPKPNDSTIGGPTLWSNFQRPAQLPMMPPPRPAPQNQWQSTPQQPIWTSSWGPHFESSPGLSVRPSASAPGMGFPSPPEWLVDEPQRSAELTASEKVDDCVRTLRMMGYGEHDLNERARLVVYAGAAGGDLLEAVDMIEEERKVAAAMDQGVRSIRTL